MSKKIFRSIFVGSMAVLLASLVVILGALYSYFVSLQSRQLEQMLYMAVEATEEQGRGYLSALHPDGYRLTLVSTDGTVLFDSETSAEAMENHAGREEINEALQYGSGESARYSTTLMERTVYLARRLQNGSVLRISDSQATAWALLLGSFQPILLVIAMALILSLLLAGHMSKRIVKPLNELDLEHPLEKESYDELAPLLTRIDGLHRQVQQQLVELRQQQDEFSQITGNMHEGLVLLDHAGKIISMNPAACRLWAVSEDCTGRDFAEVDHSHDLWEVFRLTWEQGHGSMRFTRQEHVYELDISRIDADGEQVGLALLAIDITDQADAENRRREFTANVSHELKTPLQGIMGSAELMEQGLVRQEDMPQFIGQIRLESARLLTLIEDIIRLSQLDENAALPMEPMDVYALAKEEVSFFGDIAAAKHISLRLQGQKTMMIGSKQLLHEILYNLLDNAIKYNMDGGSVTVTVSSTETGIMLSVADTGIGIPPEHQSRVFERFYRVDKSHSKATGGTGLGLSIVKHAASDMGGTVALYSEPSKGTTVTLQFPTAK